MSWLLAALTDTYARADELDRPHDTEYDGGHYITPSLIDHDDGKETRSIGEEAQRATVRTPRT